MLCACDPPKKDESGLKPWTYEPPKEPTEPVVTTRPAVKPSEKEADEEEDKGPYPIPQLAIARAMSATKPAVAACAKKFKASGLIKATLTIGNKGRVSTVTLGSEKGTATGRCVEEAVKSAVFPPFDGHPFTIEYPYMLR
jgi:hypothetical protein